MKARPRWNQMLPLWKAFSNKYRICFVPGSKCWTVITPCFHLLLRFWKFLVWAWIFPCLSSAQSSLESLTKISLSCFSWMMGEWGQCIVSSAHKINVSFCLVYVRKTVELLRLKCLVKKSWAGQECLQKTILACPMYPLVFKQDHTQLGHTWKALV